MGGHEERCKERKAGSLVRLASALASVLGEIACLTESYSVRIEKRCNRNQQRNSRAANIESKEKCISA
jgi:hypothetical protein